MAAGGAADCACGAGAAARNSARDATAGAGGTGACKGAACGLWLIGALVAARGAGVAGGLGDYFRVEPVLFRVLFATAAFFGGAGVLGYLLAWAAIPEEGTEKAAIDGWVASLRRRRVLSYS